MPDIYTTPKTIAACVATDVMWQSLSQFLDPMLEESTIGGMNAVNFTNYVAYPMGLAVITAIYLVVDYRRIKKSLPEVDRQQTREENTAIVSNIFLGMMGWMAGYALAVEQDMDRWETASMAGVGSAIPLLLFNYGYDNHRGSQVDKQNYAVAGVILSISGFLWATAYDIPGDISAQVMPHWAAGVLSCLLTGLFTAGTLLTMKAYEDRTQQHYKALPSG